MKKVISVLMCTILLLTFAGCSPATEQAEWDDAVDVRLVNAIGASKTEVMETFGLTEEDHSEVWPGVYLAELNWYGMPMETEIGFFDDVCVSASAKSTFPDDEETYELMKDCLTMFEEQFNAPYRYDVLDFDNNSTSCTYEIPDRETFFKTLSEENNGGVSFRYSLSGENDGTGTKGPYIDVIFAKYKNDPGHILITVTVRDLIIK